MIELDKAFHIVALATENIHWRDFREVGLDEPYYDYYYAEDELYIIRDRVYLRLWFCKARSPKEAWQKYEPDSSYSEEEWFTRMKVSCGMIMQTLADEAEQNGIEIIRCKDCKHRDVDGFCEGRGWPIQLVPDDGFCDKGKRSEK